MVFGRRRRGRNSTTVTSPPRRKIPNSQKRHHRNNKTHPGITTENTGTPTGTPTATEDRREGSRKSSRSSNSQNTNHSHSETRSQSPPRHDVAAPPAPAVTDQDALGSNRNMMHAMQRSSSLVVAEEFETSFSDMLSTTESYYPHDPNAPITNYNAADADVDDDGYYYYHDGDDDDDDDDDAQTRASYTTTTAHNDEDEEENEEDPYVLFRLMDHYCSVNETTTRTKNWAPIRAWLHAMLLLPPGETTTTTMTEKDRAETATTNLHAPLLRAAVLAARGRSGQTVLHAACERSVPLDILDLLLTIGEHYGTDPAVPPGGTTVVVPLPDCTTVDGWLPLHYACNYPNHAAVVRRLVEVSPASKMQQDLKGRTPLHFLMREENMNRPAVVALFRSAAGIADDNGILPLHYACLYGASEDFLRILTDAYPEGINSTDKFGRVPLHYSLSNSGRSNAPSAVRLFLGLNPTLVNLPGIARTFMGSDAVRKYDRLILVDAAEKNDETTTTHRTTNKNKNHHHHNSTTRKKQKYGKNGTTTGGTGTDTGGRQTEEDTPHGGGKTGSGGGGEDFSCDSVEECLKRFLEAKPNPTADFFTALQSLPESLREKAVLVRVVQELLNQKIGQRFPTAILLLDLYLQIIVAVFYTFAVYESIVGRFSSSSSSDSNADNTEDSAAFVAQWRYLGWLYVGLTYFLVQEIVQLISLISLKASWIWLKDPGNWLNVIYIGFLGSWTVFMSTGWCDRDIFRTGAAISFGFIWIKFLSYLRNILIDFAVFSGGVFHVLRRLLAFLMCLTIILIAFSRMFFTLFYETEYCAAPSSGASFATTSMTSIEEDRYSMFPYVNTSDQDAYAMGLICESNARSVQTWCNAWDSFIAVYTMLLGEVDETVFENDTAAIILFVVFMLLVVILLANVLIAIVTDSYKVIRDKRAAIVFWMNRLDFIAQMDAISNGPWKTRLRSMLGMDGSGLDTRFNIVEVTFGQELWNDIIELFDHTVEEGIFSSEFLLCILLRFVAIIFVPFWIVGGALVVGLLWPPQIREKLFISTVTKHSSELEKEENLRKTQIERLRIEINVLKDELLGESAQHRTQIVQMKSAIAERKLETRNNLTTIKRNIVLALEYCEA